MDYAAIIPVAAFFVGIQLATKANAHPLYAASIGVLLPYSITLVTRYIMAIGYNLPILSSLFSLQSVTAIIIQFLLGLYVFKRLRDEEGIAATFIWGLGGLFGIVFLTPLLVGLIIR